MLSIFEEIVNQSSVKRREGVIFYIEFQLANQLTYIGEKGTTCRETRDYNK